ncbi:leucine-rich repeat domain-containing protein [Ascoidea rubescens DSM 1968]|uniref:L domain-like protein n=1 Tax=Ascoidea rubescens DSM 1968 TaxID=1344418 RepID=A0A1D2VK39_9ASCO|nr:L domain-like protein [Ascoidea rubescens DSM 1968]ODV61959.1 L domain-like protein [Ascoidea rubescens DSM 1968]
MDLFPKELIQGAVEAGAALKLYNSVFIHLTRYIEYNSFRVRNKHLYNSIDSNNEDEDDEEEEEDNDDDDDDKEDNNNEDDGDDDNNIFDLFDNHYDKKLDVSKDSLYFKAPDFIKLNSEDTKCIQNYTILLNFFELNQQTCNLFSDILKKTENLKKINLIISGKDNRLCKDNYESLKHKCDIWNKLIKLLILLNSNSLKQIIIYSKAFSINVSNHFWFLNQLTESEDQNYSVKNTNVFLKFESFNKCSSLFKEQKSTYMTQLTENNEHSDGYIDETKINLDEFPIDNDIFFKELNSFMRFSIDFLSFASELKIKHFSPSLKMKTVRFLGHSLDNIENLTNEAEFTGLDLSRNNIYNISCLSQLVNLKTLNFSHNKIEDISPLSNLNNLRSLNLSNNENIVLCVNRDNQNQDEIGREDQDQIQVQVQNNNPNNHDDYRQNGDNQVIINDNDNKTTNSSPSTSFETILIDGVNGLLNNNAQTNNIAQTDNIYYDRGVNHATFNNLDNFNLINEDQNNNPNNHQNYQENEDNEGEEEGENSNDNTSQLIEFFGEFQFNQQLRFGKVEVLSFTSVEPISKLILLKDLNLSGNYLSEVSCLRDLVLLTDLNLNNNQIIGIKFISYLKNLKTLSFSSNRIENIDSLSELKELVYLEGNNNLIKNVQKTLFSSKNAKNFQNLKNVNFSANRIENLNNIYIPKNIKYFDFSWNKVNNFSIENPQNLSKLKIIKLNDNQLIELKNFEIPNNVWRVFIQSNKLRDFSIKFNENQLKLRSLDLSYNQLINRNQMNIPSNVKVNLSHNL